MKLIKILHQLSIKRVFEVELRQVRATLSHTRKFDKSIMSFLRSLFYCPVFENSAQ